MNFTKEELTIIRKALQILLMAYMVTNTAEGKDDRETVIDELIRRIREGEG
jgi:hypothetical protein